MDYRAFLGVNQRLPDHMDLSDYDSHLMNFTTLGTKSGTSR